MRNFFKRFSVIDALIWSASVVTILLAFFLSKNTDYVQLAASLVGACSLILIANGNVIGQVLSVIFSVFYGVISYFTAYYGEMITYLGMTAPMAIFVIIEWLRHPFHGKKTEVTVNRLHAREYPLLIAIAAVITVVFYFILRAIHTQNLLWSSLSVFTSGVAVLLTIRRSPFYAVAYACNDVVLIILWSLMLGQDSSYLAMVVCFSVFLVNDFYSFVNWLKLRKRQAAEEEVKLAPPR